jgi:hypothetical protein
MLKNWLQSIDYLAEKDIKELKYKNSAFRKICFPRFQKWLINISTNPLRHTTGLFFLVLLLSFHCYQLSSFSWFPSFSYSAHKELFKTLLTIQATLAALTYPIIIGFVSLLFQSRKSAKARLHIYLIYSGALLSGMSSLYLVMVMSLQYVFFNSVLPQVITFWTALDLTWFLFNIAGIMWFLFQTVEFIRPDKQAKVLTRYAINISWPQQLKTILKRHNLWNAQQLGYIPGAFDNNTQTTLPNIFLHPILSNRGRAEVTIHIKRNKILKDVRLQPLRWVITCWLSRAREAQSRTQPSATVSKHNLSFSLYPDKEYEGEIILCRQQGNIHLTKFERMIIKKCFIFSGGKRKPLDNLEYIFEDLQGDILHAIDQRQINAFEDSVTTMIDLHGSLIQAGAFINDQGVPVNYANIDDPGYFLGKRVHETWLQYYREIIKQSVFLNYDQRQFFETILDIATRIFNKCEKTAHPEILTKIIYIPGLTHFYLSQWWSNRVEEGGISNHNACNGAELIPPYKGHYESILTLFIGQWEWLSRSFWSDRDKPYEWSELRKKVSYFETHINQSLSMLSKSVSLGDITASYALTDIVQNWWSHHNYKLSGHMHVIQGRMFVTIEDLIKDWQEDHDLYQLLLFDSSRRNAPLGLFAMGLYNYWIDGYCILIYLLITWGKTSTASNNPLALQIAKSLIDATTLREENASRMRGFEPLTFFSTIKHLIRQHLVPGNNRRDYQNRLDNMVEKLAKVEKPEMIPGRIYEGWGSRDIDFLKDGQILLLFYLAKPEWTPADDYINKLQKLAIKNDETARKIVEHFESFLNRINEFEFSEWGYAFSYLRGIDLNEAIFSEAKEETRNKIQQIIDDIKKLRENRLQEAEIDNNRLLFIAKAASESAFDKEKAHLPISLFKEIEYVTEELNEKKIIFNNYAKGSLTNPLMANIAINEDENFSSIIKNHIASFVMSEILNVSNIKNVDVYTADNYWNELKKAVKIIEEKSTPVLLIESQTQPRWIWDWSHISGEDRHNRPDDLQIKKRNKENFSNYIMNLNNIPVCQAPVPSGSSYLVPLNIFKKLSFTKYNNELPIKTSTESTENPALVNLVLHWAQKVEIDKSLTVICLQYQADNNE